MDHVAILRKAHLKKGDNLLGDILSSRKTIESRWYVHKFAPWDKVFAGDMVYFKESGCLVTAVAEVEKVLQFSDLGDAGFKEVILKYFKEIAPEMTVEQLLSWVEANKQKRYCILIFLRKVKRVEPFDIDKTGFGNAAAWLVVGDIEKVRIKQS